jgi:segregation and condensation protein B
MTEDTEANDEPLGLEAFQDALVDDQGVSLEELTQAYADLIAGGEDPYAEAPEVDRIGAVEASDAEAEPDEEPVPEDDEVPETRDVSPRTILEAMMFVGHPENEPLTSERVASFMRGVRPQEIDQLIVELNQDYDQRGCPFRIESAGAGYRMALREEFQSLRDNFYGRVKAAKLSQAAIDVLAIVAYRQPIERDAVDRLRNRGSGALLSQLVRRGLLRIERPADKPRSPVYFTTDRFLELFGLQSLRDLPNSPD